MKVHCVHGHMMSDLKDGSKQKKGMETRDIRQKVMEGKQKEEGRKNLKENERNIRKTENKEASELLKGMSIRLHLIMLCQQACWFATTQQCVRGIFGYIQDNDCTIYLVEKEFGNLANLQF